MPPRKPKLIPATTNTVADHIAKHSTVILVDGSYFIFYRFHALLAWWKLRHADTYEIVRAAPYENPEFRAQFHKLCESSLQEIYKRLGVMSEPYQLMIAKDCMRNDIWRVELMPDYKGTRKSCPEIWPFFRYFYDHLVGCHIVLEHPRLESDDCIALMTQYISNINSSKIVIVASDNDYLQLIKSPPHISLVDLKYTSRGGNGAYDLFCKIINGDKSDNIPPVFGKNLGAKKLAELYANDDATFNMLLETHNVRPKYVLNRQLIDFDFIPAQYKEEFYHRI